MGVLGNHLNVEYLVVKMSMSCEFCLLKFSAAKDSFALVFGQLKILKIQISSRLNSVFI